MLETINMHNIHDVMLKSLYTYQLIPKLNHAMILQVDYQNDINNMLSEVDPLGNTTYYRYDNVGNIVGEIHGVDSIYQVSNNYTYNGNNQLTSVEDGNTNMTQYVYEDENMVEKTDANGDKFTYSYDENNNLTSVKSYNYTEEYTYDNYGNMTTSKIGDTKTTYTYDQNNDLIEKGNQDWRKMLETINMHNIHDVMLKSLYTYQLIPKLNHAMILQVDYQYNINNMLSEVDSLGNTTYYRYDNVGNVVGEIHGVDSIYQVSNNYTHNGNNQITSVENSNTNTTQYVYEDENMVM